MAGTECKIPMVELNSTKVEEKEAGEISRAHDQAGEISITIHEKGSTSFEEDKYKKFEEARGKLENQVTTKPKIRKVVFLRHHKNFKSYCEPRVVSLGPIHHDEQKYRLTEQYKLVLADGFIKKSGKSDVYLYEMVKKNIKQLRDCYDKEVTEKHRDEALAWILFVDGCATLQFIDSVVENKVKEFKIKNDHVAFVQQDLLLLENQLPYQLLDDLMKNSKEKRNLLKSILRFINRQSMLENDQHTFEKLEEMATNGEAIHLLDLLRKRLLVDSTPKSTENVTGQSPEDKSSKNDQRLLVDTTPRSTEKVTGQSPEDKSSKNDQRLLVDSTPRSTEKVTGQSLQDKSSKNDQRLLVDSTPRSTEKVTGQSPQDKSSKNNQSDEKDGHFLFLNVQELKAKGIRLKPNKSKCLGQISFTQTCCCYPGILQLPPIAVDDSTGPKFFNLIAYEMCPDYENDYGVTSYIAFLDSLIDEAKDVMYLKKASILFNHLGSDEEVAQLFNGISTDLVPNFEIYKDVRSKIQVDYNDNCKTWMSELLHNHFNSPWTIVAFLAALFVVLATGVQTVYSVLSYYKQS